VYELSDHDFASGSAFCELFVTLVNEDPDILVYVQQAATLHILFYQETPLHVSGGTTTHYQERKQLHLQHLVFVTLLLLPAASSRYQ
jgi:hypothetical protein